MKIALIGSTQYKEKFAEARTELEEKGHEVITPAFDDIKDLDELGVCEYNRKMIVDADEVHIIWDARSIGTIFDFGMVFALRKKVKIRYIEPKTFSGVMQKYESFINSTTKNK